MSGTWDPVAVDHEAVEVVGALELERTFTGWVPRRLPAWTRPQLPDIFMDFIVQSPSGVRVRLAGTFEGLALEVLLTHVALRGEEAGPAVFDLLVDGRPSGRATTTEGHLFRLDGRGGDVEFVPGEPTAITFEGLGPGPKVVEVWLPPSCGVELRGLRVSAGSLVERAAAPSGPRWLHHGSSISHCLEAESPLGTWPAVAAHAVGADLRSFGFAGQCMLDGFVARTLRDEPADLISVKLGINVVNGDTMAERTFIPAVHAFLDLVRDGHPEVPLLVISPIYCPSVEERPGPTIAGADGRFVADEAAGPPRQTSLSLRRIREILAGVVAQRREAGDLNLSYLDGLELFGEADAHLLHDDLHPNAAGYRLMGERFARLGFAPDRLGVSR